MFAIGDVKLKNRLVMAPMSGITDLAFRRIVKTLGCGLVCTEMVSAMGLSLGKKKTLNYLKSHMDEGPLCVQIFGAKADAMSQAAEIAAERGASIIDINMGCPAKKVLKTGAGGALLSSPKTAEEILLSVRKVSSIPMTVKIRSGWNEGRPNAVEMARLAEQCGADAITVHPRFVKQSFSGKADWSLITRVKEQVKIPVIGNGDIFTPGLALEMRRQTGCDGIMIGRGAIGNPWIFSQTQELEKGLPVHYPVLDERRELIMEHFRHLSLSMGENRAALKMRGLLLWYTKGLPRSARYRGEITQIKDLGTMISTLDGYFSSLEGM